MLSKESSLWVLAGVLTIGLVAIITLIYTESTQDDGVSPAAISSSETPQTTSGEEAPLYISTMTHMEGNFKDDQVEALFERHVAEMRFAMDLFDAYGAKLTFESEQSFAKANTNWGTNILKEAVDRGHGVGTHMDGGASVREQSITTAQMTEKFKVNKALVDGLVGANNNRGTSGGTSAADWVLAASGAGFVYMDAVTGFGYLHMSMDNRPEGWTDEYIRSTTYHDPIPLEFADRIYVLPLANAEDLEPDADPAIVVLGGDIGELASLAEGRINCFPNCTFDEADIQVVVDKIKEADRIRDHSRVARINMHIPLILLNEKNEAMLRKLLEAIKPYVDNGTVVWATQGQTYDGYVSF